MKRHETLIDREANARNISEATKIRKELLAWKQESLENIHAQDRQQSAKEFMTIISWLHINESDQLSIFESMYEKFLSVSQFHTRKTFNLSANIYLRPRPGD